jgi:hypothetical protein
VNWMTGRRWSLIWGRRHMISTPSSIQWKSSAFAERTGGEDRRFVY